MKYFKGDLLEIKMVAAGLDVLNSMRLALNEFHDDIYGCVKMGELLYDEKRVPLTNAIKRDIFVGCFREIFEAWAFCGTFESYILVFKKIFGENVEIVFGVPAPGKLTIGITTSDIVLSNFISRVIENNQYVFDSIVDEEDDNIVFQSVAGFETSSELEVMLFTMVPNGIYTEVSLTIATEE